MCPESPAPRIWIPSRREELPPRAIEVIDTVLGRLPKFPTLGGEVIELLSAKEPDTKKVVNSIAADPALAARVLAAVNSTWYGLRRKTDNIRLAIVMLGFKEVLNIVLSTGIKGIFGEDDRGGPFSVRDVWMHSYLTAVCAEQYADPSIPQHAGVLFTLGILHDVGRYAFSSIAGIMEARGMKLKSADDVPPEAYRLQREEHVFGVNHAIVGMLLARRWNLSNAVCAAIECHHYPSFYGIDSLENADTRSVAAVTIADLIVNRFLQSPERLPEPHQQFFAMLGLEPSVEACLTPALSEKLESARQYIVGLSG